VEILRRPSWFTPGRVLALSVFPLAAVGLSLIWILALRRVVARQTEQIRQRLASEATAQMRLALVWETSADGMRLADAEGMVVRVNTAYCRLLRQPREALEGQLFTVALAAERTEAVLAAYREDFARRRPAPRQEVAATLRDGTSVWFELTNVFLEHPGSPPLLLSQFRDITERKLAEGEKERLQDQLLQARKTESIGRLAGGVAHDFNNMLQVILGNAMLALEQDATLESMRESLQQIQTSAQRSADLTRQLLAFARKQAASPKVLDLNDKVAGTLGMLQRLIGEHIQLAFTPGANLWPVRIDPAQLDQILVNLTVNARDAIEGAGRIGLVTTNVVLEEAQARSELDCPPGEYVLLSITDTGHGIDAEARQHLFEPFFTTKEQGKGTGLGLATVFGIVRQNLGGIGVQSEARHGATFRIYLPRAEIEAPVFESVAPPPPARGTETILLVEDEEQILLLGRRVLIQQGYTVLAARSPEEAIELVTRHQGPIHLLVTDVVMPHMNGRQLRDALERLRPQLPTVFISGYTADIVAHHGVLDDGVQLLQKPFTAHTLTAKIREVLDATGAGTPTGKAGERAG
jgi:PAS domain S-box-containing protein